MSPACIYMDWYVELQAYLCAAKEFYVPLKYWLLGNEKYLSMFRLLALLSATIPSLANISSERGSIP